MADNNNNVDWITPLLGFVGLLAGSLFLSGQNQNNNNQNQSSLPPPPMGAKPSKGCGCSAGKK